jgi:predicted nucleotidyltransferase
MSAAVLEDAERRFLLELSARGVRFLVIGMSAAVLQGARGVTEDIDLWFERLDDPRIAEAARAVGGVYVTGTFGMQPPQLGGALGDRFDVVAHVHGVRPFAQEDAEALEVTLEGVPLRLMPLRRILASKRAANRPKDLAQIPALEEAIAVIEERGRSR